MSVNALGITALLKRVGLSQRQLAFKIGLQPAAISLMLQGKRQILLSEVALIADALGVDGIEVSRLFGVPMTRVITEHKSLKIDLLGKEVKAIKRVGDDITIVLG